MYMPSLSLSLSGGPPKSRCPYIHSLRRFLLFLRCALPPFFTPAWHTPRARARARAHPRPLVSLLFARISGASAARSSVIRSPARVIADRVTVPPPTGQWILLGNRAQSSLHTKHLARLSRITKRRAESAFRKFRKTSIALASIRERVNMVCPESRGRSTRVLLNVSMLQYLF